MGIGKRAAITAVVAAAWLGTAGAATARADEAREQRLERELQDLRRRLDAMEKDRAGAGTGTEKKAADPVAEVRAPWDRDELSTPRTLRGVYDKPFLASLWRKVYLGGYTELEYHSFRDDPLGIPEGFRAHRTNLFTFAEVSDRIRFGAEIEFEHEEPGEDLEIKVEMAFIDWVIFEELTFRGGVILVPLGRINVNHDGPVRELTDRPMVSTFVIPTTLSDAGVGVVGTLRPAGAVALAYEAYVVNGFELLDANGQMAAPIGEREQLLREGRPSLGGDFNEHPSTTGRVGVTLFDALTAGGSWNVGTYDERGDNVLTILAADLSVAAKGFAVEGEFAWAGFERDAFARTAGIPDVFWGFYAQASYSFGPPAGLRRVVPSVFDDPSASFTLVVRYDWIDLDDDISDAIEPGVNFRPFSDTVLKFSYRFGMRGVGASRISGGEGFDDSGFVFGFTTYF